MAELKSLAEVALQWPEQAGPENYQDVLEISQHLQHTIETLLQLARSNAATDDCINVHLAHLISSTIRHYSTAADAREIRFEVHIPPAQTWHTQQSLLEVIFNNLISNAVAYAPSGSIVTIRSAANRLVFTNSAPDLSIEDVPHLFDRMWRKDAVRSTSDAHSGLGLALVPDFRVVRISTSLSLRKTFATNLA